MIAGINFADGQPSLRGSAALLLLVLASVCGHATSSLAHDEADWIGRNPEYVDRFGFKCCGPGDCERIPESFVRDEGLDIHVLPTRQLFRKGDHGAYQSRDSSWWWCKGRQLPGQGRPPATCIFFPFYGH
jgi:hypothetical protein